MHGRSALKLRRVLVSFYDCCFEQVQTLRCMNAVPVSVVGRYPAIGWVAAFSVLVHRLGPEHILILCVCTFDIEAEG